MLSNLYHTKKFGLVAVLMFAMLLIVSQVSAARISCRSDPIVFLSDGTRLQFNTEISTSLDDIISIRYEVHVPVGVSADRINYTPSWARAKELVVIVADQPAGSYRIVGVAMTGTPSVPMTVSAMMVSAKNGGQGSSRQSASGLSGQAISLSF